MSTKASRGFSIPLAARIFLALAILVAIAVAVAAVVTLQQGKVAGDRAVADNLKGADSAQRRFEELSFEKLDIIARVIAVDPDFARYVASATDDGIGLGESAQPPALDAAPVADPAISADGSAVVEPVPVDAAPVQDFDQKIDRASVKDLLVERRDDYRFGLGMLLDSEGVLVARTDEREAFKDDFRDDPLVGPTVDSLEPVVGYWRDGYTLYQAAVRPVALEESLVGFLLVASAVDAELAKQISQVSGGDVVFWLQDGEALRLVASSLSSDAEKMLEESMAPRVAEVRSMLAAGEGLKQFSVTLGQTEYSGQVAPLFGQEGQAVGGVMTLTSKDAARAPFESIQHSMLIGALLAIALALAVSWALARRVLKPVTQLAQAAEQAAGGNYQQHIAVQGNDEVARLSQALDSLLSDLREKKDIEGYVGNLSRYLPDPAQEVTSAAPTPPPKPVTRLQSVLVGLELRRFLKAPPPGEEAIALTALGQLVEEAEARARAQQGELLEQEGPRLLFGFAGANGEQRALASLSSLWNGRLGAAENAAAAAVASGEIVHGALPARPGAAATLGMPVLQVERLLAETPTGAVLLAPGIGEAVKRAGKGEVLKVANGQSSGKRFLALAREGLAAFAAAPTPPGTLPGAGQSTVVIGAAAPAAPAVQTRGSDSASTRLAVGMRFAGRFEILSILGAGGMGMVYKARDVELNDLVALKMLRPGMVVDAEQLERLKSELKLARKITHPNVLRTYDFGDFQGVPYISMEYVRGLTLRYLLQQAGRLPYSAALRIARQVAMGLDAAHQVGVIHRDIKPDNVIIEQSGNAKLMDFGIARPARRTEPGQTQQGVFIGTPAYASPEQLSGIDLDARADIYSTGVMLTEMFCGKLPFEGSDTMQMYLAHLQKPPIKPSVLWDGISPALEEILLKCMEKKPDDRYAGAADLLVALSMLRA